jgi:diguanylate cyclase (GGDEF)-like protein
MNQSIKKIFDHIQLLLIVAVAFSTVTLLISLSNDSTFIKLKNLQNQKEIIYSLVNLDKKDNTALNKKLENFIKQLDTKTEKLFTLYEYNFIESFSANNSAEYTKDLEKLEELLKNLTEASIEYYNLNPNNKNVLKKSASYMYRHINSMIFKDFKYNEQKNNIYKIIIWITFFLTLIIAIWLRVKLTMIFKDVDKLSSLESMKLDLKKDNTNVAPLNVEEDDINIRPVLNKDVEEDNTYTAPVLNKDVKEDDINIIPVLDKDVKEDNTYATTIKLDLEEDDINIIPVLDKDVKEDNTYSTPIKLDLEEDDINIIPVLDKNVKEDNTNVAPLDMKEKKSSSYDNLRKMDQVTGLKNYHGMIASYEEKIDTQETNFISITELEIDNFLKSDQYSHDIIETTLKEITFILSLHTQDSDIIAKTGNNQFTIILYRQSELDSFNDINTIHKDISKMKITNNEFNNIHVSVSAGFMIKHKSVKIDEVLETTNKLMQLSRRNGGDMISQIKDLIKNDIFKLEKVS